MISYKFIKDFLDLNLGLGLSLEAKEKLHEEFYDELYEEILADFEENYLNKIWEKVEIFNKKQSWDDI